VPADLAKEILNSLRKEIFIDFLNKSIIWYRNNIRPSLDFRNLASAERTNVILISDPSFDAFETVGMTA
jgi:hypothetical protein